MAQLLEYIKMAVDNIRANKGRSILTMLGIIIGISSVIMIMSIGQGAKGEISDQLKSAVVRLLLFDNSDHGNLLGRVVDSRLHAHSHHVVRAEKQIGRAHV